MATGGTIASVTLAPADGRWTLDFEVLLEQLVPATRAVVLNSPNNPTGYAMPGDRPASDACMVGHILWRSHMLQLLPRMLTTVHRLPALRYEQPRQGAVQGVQVTLERPQFVDGDGRLDRQAVLETPNPHPRADQVQVLAPHADGFTGA